MNEARQKVLEDINKEFEYAEGKWDNSFDDKNTANDWVAYVASYAGRGLTYPWNGAAFRKAMIKAAVLAISAIETYDRNNGNMAKRHYD